MRVKTEIVSKYVDADEFVVINDNDPDLQPIVLKLPSPPPMTMIDGYGLPIEEQRFKRLEIPPKLLLLDKEVLNLLKEELEKDRTRTITLYKRQKKFWDTLMSRHRELRKEIDFIRRVWWHRLHGYWFYNRGKPTYITGWHFMYLNFWTMPVEKLGLTKPKYYDRDRKEFLFHKYIYTTDETFGRLDEQGYAIPEPDGTFKMIKLGKRVFVGIGQPKNRRSGNTNKGLCIGLDITSLTIGSDGMGIMSYTGENAESAFKEKLMPAFDEWPIWLKPYTSTTSQSNEIKFNVPRNEHVEKGLRTLINYASSGNHKFYDSKKLYFALLDEEGKDSENEILKRWDVVKNTLAQGNMSEIHGYAYHPSTVDEIADGAFDYRYLMEHSNFYRRIEATGQTFSAMARMFVPADEALTGSIDSYGYSVKGEIQDYQFKEGFTQTSTEKLLGRRDALLKDGSAESMRLYREEKKLFPMSYADCWLGDAGEIGFDLEKIDQRLAELRRQDDTVRGNFEWVNGQYGGDVTWVPDDEKGRFELAMHPPKQNMNNRRKVMHYSTFEGKMVEMYMPSLPGTFTLGADPFKFQNKNDANLKAKKTGSRNRLSDGGIAVIWNYDDSIDHGKSPYEWESYKSVLSYRYRPPNNDIYSEDVLKAAIYYGAMVYPETNVEDTYAYFIKNNFGGYLLYDEDPMTGRIKDKPGVHSLEASKQRLFMCLRNYIDTRCHVEPFAAFLLECKHINGMEEMGVNDRLTAHGLALMGAASTYPNAVKEVGVTDYDLSDYIEFFDV